MRLPNKMSVEPDQIPNLYILTKSLCIIFLASMNQGVFPNLWKKVFYYIFLYSNQVIRKMCQL